MRPHLILALAATLGLPTARAGLACFSSDGKTVTFVPKTDEGCLRQLDVASGKLTTIPLGGSAAKGTVTSLCLGSDGEILFTTGDGIFVHDAKGTRPLAPAPVKGVWGIDSLAAAPPKTAEVGDWLFLSGNDPKDAHRRIFYSQSHFVNVIERSPIKVLTPRKAILSVYDKKLRVLDAAVVPR